MLAHQHGHAKLAVEAGEHGPERAGGDGVEHGGGLVEHHEAGLHGGGRGQGEQLLLPARKPGGAGLQQPFQAEEGRDFGHAAADERGPQALVFEREGQFFKHRVQHDLAVGVLLHEAHARPRRHPAGALSGGGQRGQSAAQQGGFAAARGAAEQHELPLPYGEVHAGKKRRHAGVGKAEVFIAEGVFHGAGSFLFGGVWPTPRRAFFILVNQGRCF